MSLNTICNKLVGLLFILLPFSIVSGPFLPDLTFVIFCIYFFFNIKIGLKLITNNKFIYAVIIFWIVIILGSFFSNFFLESFTVSVLYIRYLIGSLGIALFLLKNNNHLLFFGYSLLICFAILIFDGFFQFIFEFNIFGIPLYEQDRLSSFFGSELKLGSYLSRLMPLCFFFVFYFKEKFNIYLILFFLISLDVLVFLTGERVAFGYLTMTTILMVILLKDYKMLRLLTFISSIIIIIFISFNFEIIKKRMIDQTLLEFGLTNIEPTNIYNDDESLNNNLGLNKFYAFTPHHQSHYSTALKMFLEKIIIGQGSNSFRYECLNINPLSCSTHPHNSYIQLLAENGIIGFSIIFAFFIYLSYLLIKIFSQIYFLNNRMFTDDKICLLLCFFISFWPLVPTGNFYNNWLNIIYYLPLSFYMYLNFIRKN